jgi:hypothetical protein
VQAETARVYDAQGHYQGRVETGQGGQARLYDSSGRYQGRVTSQNFNGGEARLYGPAGNFRGRITQTPPSNAKTSQDGR